MAGLAITAAPSAAQDVRIGELNSYSRMAVFSVPYRNGMQLAQEEINAKGGVMGGKKMDIVFRDDGGTPSDAVRVAEELLTRENVSFLAGTFLSNVGLAVGDFANQKKVLFLATEPLTDAITMAQGNKYTYRVRPDQQTCPLANVPCSGTMPGPLADDRSNCSEMTGKRMTLKSPAATSAAALAGLMACN
jgi:branched-chain amino acid transport system substrate-binding protein